MSASPARIGYVVKRFPRYSETFIVNEILAHEMAGLDVEIFSLRPPNDAHFQDMLGRLRAPVHYVPSEGLKAVDLWTALQEAARVLPGVWSGLTEARGADARDVYQALVLARKMQERSISHLHAHFAGLTASVARLAARFSSLPFSLTAHAKDIFHESVRTEDLQRNLAEAAAAVTVSDFNLAHLRSVCGASATRALRIYNGIDLDRFSFTPPSAQVEAARIVSVGRLVEKKGFADLIDACSLLARDRGFSCEIIGTGELEMPLQAQIERQGLESRVRLAGPRPQAEIIEAVRNATVFVAPCVIGSDGNRDGLPTTLLEAMALGTPCVATDVTAIPEVIKDGTTGLLVHQRDVPRLAEAIARLIDSHDLRRAVAREARTLIEREFNVHANTARLRTIFAQVGEPAGVVH